MREKPITKMRDKKAKGEVMYLWVYSKQPQTNATNDHDIYDDVEWPKDFITVIMTAL